MGSLRFLLVVPILVASAGVAGTALSAKAMGQTTGSDFSVVVIPDPQNYSTSYPEVFKREMQWVADNVTALNIRMVIGEGDMVNHDATATEWTNADSAVDLIDGRVPYAFAIGNHDYDNQNPAARGATQFNARFGPARYAGYSWYGGNYRESNENFYTFFSSGSDQYMVLVLEFYPRDDVITWANSVLNSYPEKRVIVVTHSFEGTDGMRVDLCDTQDMRPQDGNTPQLVWSKLLKQHANAFLVLSGHLIGNGSAHRSDLGDNGNLVHQIFSNFQDWTGGREGYIRILKFHPDLNRMDVITYSPWSNTYQTSPTYQFSLPIKATPTTQATGRFEGKVRSSDCIRIPGAQVSTAGFSTTTDVNGVYSMPNLPAPNGYALTAGASYFGSNTALSEVRAGYSTQLNFLLKSTVAPACALSTVRPSITICSPLPNARVASPVRVNAGAKLSRTPVYMQMYVDGVNRGTFYTSAIDQSVTLPAGAHRVTLQAKDTGGALTKTTVYFTVGSASTTKVTITAPINNAVVSSPFAVRAAVTPATGATITSTTVYLDGVNVYTVRSTTLSTSVTAAAGTHRVTVQAKDSTGAYAKSTVYVTVK